MFASIAYCTLCGNKHPDQTCATNPTQIVWKYGGTQVHVFGSWPFSLFQVGTKLIKSREYPFYHQNTLLLTPGRYRYKFKVDGQWKLDPNEQTVPNSMGGLDNEYYQRGKSKQKVMTMMNQRHFHLLEAQNSPTGPKIQLKQNLKQQLMDQRYTLVDHGIIGRKKFIQKEGSYSMLSPLRTFAISKLDRKGNSLFILKSDTYEYKFLIQNQWFHDPSLPSVPNEHGSYNNIIQLRKRESSQLKTQDFSKAYWHQYKLNMRFERINGHSMTAIGNSFYVFGGGCTGTFSNKLYRMNIKLHQLDIVDTNGHTPDPRGYHNAIPYGQKIIFYGGLNSHKVFNDYFVFDASTNEWSYGKTTGDIPKTRERATTTLLGREDTFIHFGGYSCTYDMEVEETFNDVHCLSLKKMKWNKLVMQGDIPEPRYAHTSTQIQDKMYVFGGQNTTQNFLKNKNFNDFWILDLSHGKTQWINMAPQIKGQPPEPRHGHSATLIQKNLFIFGGRGNTSKDLFNDLHILDLTHFVWTKPQINGTQPSPRVYHAAEMYDNNLWLLGGTTGMQQNQHVYILSFSEKEESGGYSSPYQKERYEDDAESSDDAEYKTQLHKIKNGHDELKQEESKY